MDPKTVHEHRDEVQILDVREDTEWAAGRIDGARHIPLEELAERLDQLDPHRPVVTVCRGGGRASRASDLLVTAGWTVHTMDGGITGWAAAGLPVTTPDGRAGHVA